MGPGKKTLASVLAAELQGQAFIEPEAEAWPIPENESWQQHVFKLEQWVRETQLNNLTQARRAAESGKLAVSDCGFVLINYPLITAACNAWYFGNMSAEETKALCLLAEQDWHHAPIPDVIIYLETEKALWMEFLQQRGRSLDKSKEMIANFDAAQTLMADAAERYAAAHQLKLIRYQNTKEAPPIHATRLAKLISSTLR
jgi:deoxyadenosine/deoxycytidine kinase